MKVLCSLIFAALISSSMMAKKAELQVLNGNSLFTNNLYKTLAEQEGNVFFSPISIHAVLSILYEGAQSTTAEKLSTILNVPEPKSTALGYRDIIIRLNSIDKITLLMKNKIYVSEKAQLSDDYKNDISRNFLSQIQPVDFNQKQAAVDTVNNWVKDQTEGKIQDLIQRNDVDKFTRLVLVNAVYFKADWLTKFDKADTKTEPFYVNDRETVNVEMMHRKVTGFHYASKDDLDAQVLELRYINKTVGMYIILPNDRNGIKQLEEKLSTIDITDVTKGLWNSLADVAIPKFKIEQKLDLKDALIKLGLGEIFDEYKANFAGIVNNNDLHVNKIVQKSFIEVNEEGAEASAATSITVAVPISANSELRVHKFHVDHPFIFLIVHKFEDTVTPIFMGRINKP